MCLKTAVVPEGTAVSSGFRFTSTQFSKLQLFSVEIPDFCNLFFIVSQLQYDYITLSQDAARLMYRFF